MSGNVQEITLGKTRYVFGMDWYILEPAHLIQQIDELADRHETKIGARVGSKLNPGVGFMQGQRKTSLCSAAASLAKQLDNTILVQPLSLLGGPADRYWVVAIQDRRIMPGSDIVLEKEDALPLIRRFRVLGDFNLVGCEDFLRDNFPELDVNKDYFIQNATTLQSMLARTPVRLRQVAKQKTRYLAIAVALLFVIGSTSLLYIAWQKKREQELLAPKDQPSSEEIWRAQLPVVRGQIMDELRQKIGPSKPGTIIVAMLDVVGNLEPFQDDWYVSKITCTLSECASEWTNRGLSDNKLFDRRLADLGRITFVPTGKSATLSQSLEIPADREDFSILDAADLLPEQDWLRENGSMLQHLMSVGIQVGLGKPAPSKQFPPSPDGSPLIGPDVTFHYGEYRIAGKQYFMIRDAIKRLAEKYFSIRELQVKFNEDQETTGWEVKGHYVWK